MQLSKKLEAEIKDVMNDYWNSYFEGKLDRWGNYLAEDYKNIGGTEEEIWNSKTGYLQSSDQLLLTKAIQNAGGPHGYLIVIEIDDKKAAVTLRDIISYLK